MININTIKAVYFIGVGGIGMSSLARYFVHKGIFTAGYDRTKTPLTEQLRKEHIMVQYIDDSTNIPALYTNGQKNRTVIIYTPAIPNDNEILQFFKSNNFNLYKRSEILGLITKNIETIGIAGTHAKTSVSVLTAWIMKHSNLYTDAFLGGISKNLNSNLMLSDSNKKTELIVTEADEFDRSFLHLNPKTAVITSLDADHLDIYGNFDNLKKSFSKYIGKITDGGNLIIKTGVDLPQDNFPENVYRYALTGPADFYAENIRTDKNLSKFDIVYPEGKFKNAEIQIAGKLNIENAIAATTAAILSGATEPEIKKGLSTWQGTQRRFEYVINTKKMVFIDDYAHHPEEIKAFISSVKGIYPDKEITGIFQPHLYSRTRDFAQEFAQELSKLDRVILTPLYPAREKPIAGVDSNLIFKNISNKRKIICQKKDLVSVLKNEIPEVLLLMGAGDISQQTKSIENFLLEHLKENKQ